MSDPQGQADAGRATTSAAVPALVLAVAGFACCGLPALAGAVLARRELAAIDAGRADPAGRPTARLALVLGLVTAGLWLCGVVGYLLLLVESGFVR